LRQRVQCLVARIYELHSAKAASAGIAALMSDCSVDTAMAQATLRFRCVRLALLDREIFLSSPTSSVPTGPQLLALTEVARLGECDAFLSHSWHDCAQTKWAALQQWRSEFVERRGREPRIWFDKCCIDQTDIAEDLRGLPIFLSGCQELLVLCGKTYLTRLWCVVELFTFAHMGGRADRIRVIPLLQPGQELEDAKAILEAFSKFDASKCDCFNSSDKKKMMDIMDTAYAGIDGFTAVVHKFFHDSGLAQNLMFAGCLNESTSSSTSIADPSGKSDDGVV